jgi:hypothetical protein
VGFVHQRRVPGSRAQIIVAVDMTMPTAQTHPVGHGQPGPGQSDGAGGTAQAAKTAISIKDAATTKRLPMSLCRSRRIAAAKKGPNSRRMAWGLSAAKRPHPSADSNPVGGHSLLAVHLALPKSKA